MIISKETHGLPGLAVLRKSHSLEDFQAYERLEGRLYAFVSRHHFLATSGVTIPAAGMVSLRGVGGALGQAKKSKEETKYQDQPNGQQQCSKCKHFMAGKCEIVEGDISANGWCKFFEAKS